MSQRIINARVTFHNSPIHVLERFVMRDIDDAYKQFRKHSDIEECVIIQTCNRIELFARSASDEPERIKRTWASLTGLDEEAFDQNMEVVDGHDALHHLLKLTSGLDSMVLGEEQILGQIKTSIATARETRASGRHLNTLFEKAIRIGTRIRNSTGIGRGGISVGSMAVKLAEENIDNMKTRNILLIGTGEVSTLVAKSLLRRGYAFDVTSRTMGRARSFCESLGGSPVRFEDVLFRFEDYDVLFVATTAPYSLVTYERIAESVGAYDASQNHNDGVRRHGMMILDLSNPRTVDERVATLGGVKLMNLDQISEMVEKNMATRMGKVKAVEDIIGEEVHVLEASMRRLAAEPLAERVFKRIDELRERELYKAVRAMDETDERRIRIIDDMSKSIVESILSAPMNNLRKASERGERDVIVLANRLFDYGVRSVDDNNDNNDNDNDNDNGHGDNYGNGNDGNDDNGNNDNDYAHDRSGGTIIHDAASENADVGAAADATDHPSAVAATATTTTTAPTASTAVAATDAGTDDDL